MADHNCRKNLALSSQKPQDYDLADYVWLSSQNPFDCGKITKNSEILAQLS